MSKRLKFFLAHLSCSVFIAFLLLIWIFKVWYPYPLAQALGVTNIILLLFAIDIIIGPILGFIVYKEGKKTLKFDLLTVFSLQILAFLFGFYNLSEGRPVWIVYNQGNMDLVQRVEIITTDMQYASPNFQKIPMFGPEIAAVKTLDLTKRSKERPKNISFIQQPEKYLLLDKESVNIKKNLRNISELYAKNNKQKVDELLLGKEDVQGWLPLRATTQNMVVLMSTNKPRVISIVDLKY